MPWARIDDGFHAHPKVRATSLAGRGLLVSLISYSAHYLTDGAVPREIVQDHSRGKGGRAALRELVERGFLHEHDGGYRIHDYLDFNDSRASVEAQRAANRQRQSRHRAQSSLPWNGTAPDTA